MGLVLRGPGETWVPRGCSTSASARHIHRFAISVALRDPSKICLVVGTGTSASIQRSTYASAVLILDRITSSLARTPVSEN